MTDLGNRELIFRTISAAIENDGKQFLSLGEELEQRGWDETGILILEALAGAVNKLPSCGANATAALTTRTIARFEGTLNIMRPVMEALIRDAGGEEGLITGIPRNLAMIHSLLAVSQIVYEGYLSVEETIEASDD